MTRGSGSGRPTTLRARDARLGLLGGFTFRYDGVDAPVSRGGQRLLAFLAVDGPGDRSHVAGSLWPEVTDAHAHASLRTALWRLHTSVPGVLRTRGTVLDLDPVVRVDSLQLADAARGLLRQPDARDPTPIPFPLLTAGDLLPLWDEEWVDLERERLRLLRLQALEVAVRRLLADAALDPALDLALEIVRADPLRESGRAALIRVHLAEGNLAEARRQFERFRALLARELGVPPSPALHRLVGAPRPVPAPVVTPPRRTGRVAAVTRV